VRDGFQSHDCNHFITRVNEVISDQFQTGIPHIEQIAGILNLPVWTLKRQLSKHQTTFSFLVESQQKKMVTAYLRNPHYSISEVAYQCGYADISGLTKAFHRWYGVSPKQWRQQFTIGI
jgi:AraC-like DNA-binding protein